VYTGPVGSHSVTEQIHDYNVHIDSNDVFWMVRVAPAASYFGTSLTGILMRP
jgi:hypothetical protein